jgi:hypothetical protein
LKINAKDVIIFNVLNVKERMGKIYVYLAYQEMNLIVMVNANLVKIIVLNANIIKIIVKNVYFAKMVIIWIRIKNAISALMAVKNAL